jgi:primosomal protein N'
MPLVDRLRADLDAEIAICIRAWAKGERADEWRRIRAGEVDVVVGTRTALTAPLADIGLIVVDEEHDAAYKSDRTPRLQARDAALALARLAGAAVVLGSATPSVESVGRVRRALSPRGAARSAERRAAPCRGRGPARGAGRRQSRPALRRPVGRRWRRCRKASARSW